MIYIYHVESYVFTPDYLPKLYTQFLVCKTTQANDDLKSQL